MEIETPVTDRKRSHDKMESLAPAQGGPGKALMDFEEESRGNLEDSDVADDDAFQNRSDSPLLACFGVASPKKWLCKLVRSNDWSHECASWSLAGKLQRSETTYPKRSGRSACRRWSSKFATQERACRRYEIQCCSALVHHHRAASFDIRVPFFVTAKELNARVPHQVRVECKSTVEEVDVLSLRASEASAEIAFVAVLSLQARGIFAHDITWHNLCRMCAGCLVLFFCRGRRPSLLISFDPMQLAMLMCRGLQSSHSTYSLTSYADSLHNMLKQLESEPDDPFNSSGEEMETE
jgi:hypothetical protein